MESVILTLFNLATQVKWISETSELAIRNEAHLNQISYDDIFYKKVTFSKAVSGISQNLLIVHCCSFLDEFEKHLNPSKFPEYRERIILLKKITKPAITRIKKWKNLKDHRNQIIAHNQRINGVSIFEFKSKVEYIIPTTNSEFKLLADLIFLISQNIEPVFPEIAHNIDFTQTLLDHMYLKSEKIDCKKEFEEIEKGIIDNKIQYIINNT